MSFMGWHVERDADGNWSAVKVTELMGPGYQPVGPARIRHKLIRVKRDATKEDAEREVRRLYVSNILK